MFRHIKTHDVTVYKGHPIQKIFNFNQKCFLDLIDNTGYRIESQHRVILNEYLVEAPVPQEILFDEFQLLQANCFSLDSFLGILTTIQILSILDKNGFSNLMLMNDELNGKKLFSIKFEPKWEMTEGYIDISSYHFNVDCPVGNATWHAGNRLFVLKSD